MSKLAAARSFCLPPSNAHADYLSIGNPLHGGRFELFLGQINVPKYAEKREGLPIYT
jgi:hypothetical protein